MTDTITETLRVEGGQVLATLIRLTRDVDLAEDALQEASLQAVQAWRHGVPDNPGAWLTTVAKRKALDLIRREARRTGKETEAVRLLIDDDPPPGDDRLRLMFTCCHPALGAEARVALTLRTIGGLTTPEIAAAFLVEEATMGQRISRAKKKIREAAIPYRIPADHDLPERLPAVLAVVHAIFTTGHHPPAGAMPIRVDLAEEGLRLARLLAALMPDEPEAHGLVALVAATHARRPGRIDGGEVVLLAEQDRSRWDAALVAEAGSHLELAEARTPIGPYTAQAIIAHTHSAATSWEATDWSRIVAVYRGLDEAEANPVVTVNRAVAEAMLDGPEAGLARLATAEGVDRWHLRWATEARFLTDLGRTEEAADAYRRALGCRMNDVDRRLLTERLAVLG